MKYKKPIFIIEHLEPSLYKWCLIEYKHISQLVGKSQLIITKIINKDKNIIKKLCKPFNQSIIQLIKDKTLDPRKACILDPSSPTLLTPKHSLKYQYFIFGGILGDFPAKRRTYPQLTSKLNLPAFNLGKSQFSTDNAVLVTKKITEGIPLKKMIFQNKLEIPINKIESTILPYKYAIHEGKPFISQDLIRYLIKKKGL